MLRRTVAHDIRHQCRLSQVPTSASNLAQSPREADESRMFPLSESESRTLNSPEPHAACEPESTGIDTRG
jgi:hypothetical protein